MNADIFLIAERRCSRAAPSGKSLWAAGETLLRCATSRGARIDLAGLAAEVFGPLVAFVAPATPPATPGGTSPADLMKDVNAAQELVRPAVGKNRNVMCDLPDIYTFLRARSDGAQVCPPEHEPKPAAFEKVEDACLT
jgi:hypothetical protein